MRRARDLPYCQDRQSPLSAYSKVCGFVNLSTLLYAVCDYDHVRRPDAGPLGHLWAAIFPTPGVIQRQKVTRALTHECTHIEAERCQHIKQANSNMR